jgi:hypothetical protein
MNYYSAEFSSREFKESSKDLDTKTLIIDYIFRRKNM